jgi:hypothetical protein
MPTPARLHAAVAVIDGGRLLIGVVALLGLLSRRQRSMFVVQPVILAVARPEAQNKLRPSSG